MQTLLSQVAEGDGSPVRQRLPQDPGQAGKAQVPELARVLDGFNVEFENPTGSKLLRFSPFSAQCQAGNVSILVGELERKVVQGA